MFLGLLAWCSFLKLMYVCIQMCSICLFCVSVCMYACVPIAKSSCGVRRQLEAVGCFFPPCGFGASNSVISRHQTWQSNIFPAELAHQWPYSWYSLYPVIGKVLRKLFISYNSHHHLCGALQFSLNICILYPIWSLSFFHWCSLELGGGGGGGSGVVRGIWVLWPEAAYLAPPPCSYLCLYKSSWVCHFLSRWSMPK